jgi:hypothetical protein
MNFELNIYKKIIIQLTRSNFHFLISDKLSILALKFFICTLSCVDFLTSIPFPGPVEEEADEDSSIILVTGSTGRNYVQLRV